MSYKNKNVFFSKIKFLIYLFILFILTIPVSSAMIVDIGPDNINAVVKVFNAPPNIIIKFILNEGPPIITKTDINGTAKFITLVAGKLEIIGIVQKNDIEFMITDFNVDIGLNPSRPGCSGIQCFGRPTPAGGTDTGSTGGGGGMVTSEPVKNIIKYQRVEQYIWANTPITYQFNFSEIPIYEITVKSKETIGTTGFRVESLRNISTFAFGSLPGIVYSNLNIFSDSRRINDISIRFKINNVWITDNKVKEDSIRMYRWIKTGDCQTCGEWEKLNTKNINKDDEFTYFESYSTGFSAFAISTEEKIEENKTALLVTPSSTEIKPITTVEMTPVSTVATNLTEKKNGTNIDKIINNFKNNPSSVFGLLVAIVVLMVLYRQRKC